VVTPRLILVLGDQLTPGLSALAAGDPARDLVVMAEVAGEASYVPHHPKKIAFLFAAMRKFAAELREAGWRLAYTRLDDPDNAGSIAGELLRRARLAALIPPKRIHTVRYHGVFSPASLLRPHILPRFEPPKPAACDPPLCPTDSAPPHAAAIALAALVAAGVSTNLTSPVTSEDDTSEPSTSTVEHVVPLSLIGTPLDESELIPIRSRRLDWATLLRRVYRLDVLKCPRCEGRLEVIAAISDPDVVRRILDHLGLPVTPPQCKPARGPPEDLPLFDH
jgi:hypothetical protein